MTCTTLAPPPATAAAARPYRPIHVHVRVPLRDGGSVLLRPLVNGEVSVLDGVFEGLSARSRQQRFLVPMPRLPGAHRRALADVDDRRHVAWVALVDGEPVGICRYVSTTPDTAELAFERSPGRMVRVSHVLAECLAGAGRAVAASKWRWAGSASDP